MDLKTLHMALRPWSLSASISPVMIGTACAFGDGKGSWLISLLSLIVAVCIHLGTNVVNDIGDYRSGVDSANPGSTFNVIQQGVVSEKVMIMLASGFFMTAMVLGLIAVMIQQAWIFITLGGICILAGIFYTLGPKPGAYLGLGDIMIIIFLGAVPSGGTYYLQTFSWSLPAIIGGVCCGLICNGILAINNYRDYEGDKAIGKKTLAVRFGRDFAKWEYLINFILVALGVVWVFLLTDKEWILIGLAVVSLAVPAIQQVFTVDDKRLLNETIAYTGKLLALFGVLFSVGWLVS